MVYQNQDLQDLRQDFLNLGNRPKSSVAIITV